MVVCLVGQSPICSTVREWIQSALGGCTCRIVELTMMGRAIFLLQVSDLATVEALMARSPISFGSRLLVFERWTPDFDIDEFDRQQRIPCFPVTLSFPGLPITLRDCISKVASRWGIVIPGSLSTVVGTPSIQVYALGDMHFPEVLVL